jgi:hypothetical protein
VPLRSPAAAEAAAITASETYDPVLFADGSTNSTTLSISGLINSIAKVTTTINLTKCDDPINTTTGVCEGAGSSFNEEIGLTLTSPLGTSVDLTVPGTLGGQQPGATATWTFDDGASAGLTGSLLISGTFLPTSPLSAFNGEDGNGTWTLFFSDNFPADPLSVNSWSLTVTPVPGPLPVLGVGAAFGFSRRLRRRISTSQAGTPPQA